MAVYFLDAPEVNRIKIGTGTCPENRLQAIRLMCPVPTDLLGTVPGGHAEETKLHDRFAPLRRYGEWFEGTSELRFEIALLCLQAAWEMASPEARKEFLGRIDSPLMDRKWA